jgi:hypothetical protein
VLRKYITDCKSLEMAKSNNEGSLKSKTTAQWIEVDKRIGLGLDPTTRLKAQAEVAFQYYIITLQENLKHFANPSQFLPQEFILQTACYSQNKPCPLYM